MVKVLYRMLRQHGFPLLEDTENENERQMPVSDKLSKCHCLGTAPSEPIPDIFKLTTKASSHYLQPALSVDLDEMHDLLYSYNDTSKQALVLTLTLPL